MGKCEVGVAFGLSYFCPFVMHVMREAWAMSKPDVHTHLGLEAGILGGLDLCFFFFYSLGMYVAGAMGDRLPIRLLLFGGLGLSAGLLATVRRISR